MNVILRYLLEELYEEEHGYGDMLSPYRQDHRAVIREEGLKTGQLGGIQPGVSLTTPWPLIPPSPASPTKSRVWPTIKGPY